MLLKPLPIRAYLMQELFFFIVHLHLNKLNERIKSIDITLKGSNSNKKL